MNNAIIVWSKIWFLFKAFDDVDEIVIVLLLLVVVLVLIVIGLDVKIAMLLLSLVCVVIEAVIGIVVVLEDGFGGRGGELQLSVKQHTFVIEPTFGKFKLAGHVLPVLQSYKIDVCPVLTIVVVFFNLSNLQFTIYHLIICLMEDSSDLWRAIRKSLMNTYHLKVNLV